MNFSEKLPFLRKSKGMTQEDLSALVPVSRQAVAKWESGQAYPDIANLIRLSEIFLVTVDYMVKDDACSRGPVVRQDFPLLLVEFLLRAKKNTYAAKGAEDPSSRPASHDLSYREGDHVYRANVAGNMEWFQGYEEMYHKDTKTLACFFHGGRII